MIHHSQKYLRHRKFMTVLPLLALPFLTMMFWALGGGKNEYLQNIDTEKFFGLNLNLPGAYFKEEKFDKLSLYQKVKRDSLKLMQAKRNDPYFELNTINKPVQVSEIKPEVLNHTLENKNSSGVAPFSATDKNLPDPNEELVN